MGDMAAPAVQRRRRLASRPTSPTRLRAYTSDRLQFFRVGFFGSELAAGPPGEASAWASAQPHGPRQADALALGPLTAVLDLVLVLDLSVVLVLFATRNARTPRP